MKDYKQYTDYAVEQACRLLAIDSPTGYTAAAEEWLLENMRPHSLMAYQIAVLGCLNKEQESQAAAEENEHKERDLVLEEIEAKKGPVNSHTGE